MAVSNEILMNALLKKETLNKSKWGAVWGLLNLILTLLLIVDLLEGSFAKYLKSFFPLLWYIEITLAVIFGLNFLVDVFLYISSRKLNSPIELTQNQKRMLGIPESDNGFKTKLPSGSSNSPAVSSTDAHFLSNSLNLSNPGNISSMEWTPASNTSSSFLGSPYSNLQGSPSWSSSTPSSSFSTSYSPLSSGLLDTSQLSTSSSSWVYSNNASAIRARKLNSTSPSPPTRFNDIHEDKQNLESYLKEFEEKEKRVRAEPQVTGNSFWSLGTSNVDYTPLLNKYQYQIACRSPQPALRVDTDLSVVHKGEEVWRRLGITWEEMFAWTENLRKWLSQTIFIRIVKEINQVNDTFQRLGSADLQIGEVSLSMLQQRAKDPQFPTLLSLIPYLDCTPNQEYLVQRIRELCQGGCMSEFRWNSGGSFKGKNWDDHLPTDAAIVMHMFCSYFDSRLPLDTTSLDGRAFTNVYFRKSEDKIELKKDVLCVHQTKENPPHFQLVVGQEVLDAGSGRNNMFHTILLFLHHIKTKEGGMLGRVNLDFSGINILWILSTNKT